MQKMDNQTIEVALFALVALAMLTQAIVMLAAFIVMRKAAKSADEKLEEMRSSVMPLLETSRNLFSKLAPKIDSTSDDLAAITHSLRLQTAELQSATTEIVERARNQAGRLDSMLSSALDALDRTGTFMAETINKPIRQASALLASARAVIDSLRGSVPTPRSHSSHVPGDSDTFV
jgi:ElaB/YqjD/DUF883 family membrane-anchored ribosome-binding protein